MNIFWFRRDLRLEDNKGLFHALQSEHPVQCLFIFDKNILDDLRDKDDARVNFIHQEVTSLKQELEAAGSTLDVRYGIPNEVWDKVLEDYKLNTVFTNEDFEPYARDRDTKIEKKLTSNDILFKKYTDQLIFHPKKVLKDDGSPYLVFTPYSRTWKESLFNENEHSDRLEDSSFFESFASKEHLTHLRKSAPLIMPDLSEIGFVSSKIPIPNSKITKEIIEEYDKTRDYPAMDATSKMGIHLRFGTVSIRKLAKVAAQLNETYLNELIWREFYAMIMYHFPRVVHSSFREKYDSIVWENNKTEFEAWCAGKTGYPLVDAGMRQLNTTGYMHNRVRMVVASFLTKHLLIDWRWGEAYFARRLLDYELSSNNGGWQWAAGCGTDAAPYFRIFNPESQMKKFDPEKKYIKKWVSEYGTDGYPEPIVDHKFARERCLSVFKNALNGQ